MKKKLRLALALLCTMALMFALAGCSGSDEEDETTDEGSSATLEQTTAEEDTEAEEDEEEESDPDAEAVAQGYTCKYITSYYATFAEALEKANQNGGGTITLLADTIISTDGSVATMSFRTTITVKSNGDETYSLIRGENDTGVMIKMTDGYLTFNNVIIDGSSDEDIDCAIVEVSDLGRFTLGTGSAIINGSSTSGASAVSVVGDSAYLILNEESEISDCTSGDDGAAIVSDGGVITNNGAIFSGNTVNFLEIGDGTFEGEEIE